MAKDGAYQKAEQRIAEARRTGARELNLSGLELTELPESLGQLTQLQTLDVSNNQLTALPAALGQLTQLQLLDVRVNQLTALPAALGQLALLQKLTAYSNQLTALPEALGQLTQLQTLVVSDNRLMALPEALGQLTQLQTLDVSDNQLTALPAALGQLTQLQTFNVGANQLTALPKVLWKLTQLQVLYVQGNQLTALPESLGQLTKLRELCAYNNQLTALPESLGQLTLLRELVVLRNQLTALPESLGQLRQLKELYLHENPGLGLSADILGKTWNEVLSGQGKPADPRAILAFYFAQQKGSAKPLNEVKLLLVGHGRVGKTSLSKALREIPHDMNEPETPGIERHTLPLTAGRSQITAHTWDFGGQEFLHQTHQFFFSERSIYVVVLAGRDRALMQRSPVQEAEYWLRLIRTYGTGSPVVIVLNKFQAHPFTVDAFDLQDRYPEVQAVVSADCDPRFKIPELRKLLGKLAGGMPGVREKIDPAWAKVRTELEKTEESFVPYHRYQSICAGHGVKTADQQEVLATILNCLGIALNYRNDARLRDKSILKPRWLVDGIYTMLRWLQKRLTNGVLRQEDFGKALRDKKTYPPEMHAFLLALMEKFELCFPLDARDGAYLVPGLLDENQPRELKAFMGKEARRIQFRYDDVRPPGLLPQFIVRSHTLSEKQPRWLRGVVLARGKARALVRADHDGRTTDVYALGENTEDRVWLTEFIVAEMKSLHDKLPVHTYVESEAQPGAWTELEVLREADRKGETTRAEGTADRGPVAVQVQATLREVESQEASKPKENPLPLFICYAHADERVVKQLKPSLTVLARRGYIAPWRDTDLVPGEDWDATIQERLSQARVVLLMVSRHSLASKYITEDERPLAMRLMAEKKAVVVPVLLSPCSWQEEDFARLEVLPRKGDPVSAINPREKAWALVEEGLKKVVEKARALRHDGGAGD
jgi:internalin A